VTEKQCFNHFSLYDNSRVSSPQPHGCESVKLNEEASEESSAGDLSIEADKIIL
jgi:hypothetical protein